MEESVAQVFKLADLHVANMCKACLEQLGADAEGRVHTTRLSQMLSVFPDLRAQSQGPGRCVYS